MKNIAKNQTVQDGLRVGAGAVGATIGVVGVAVGGTLSVAGCTVAAVGYLAHEAGELTVKKSLSLTNDNVDRIKAGYGNLQERFHAARAARREKKVAKAAAKAAAKADQKPAPPVEAAPLEVVAG